MKKMQFIIGEDNGSYFYSWGYTAPKKLYNDDLSIVKAMYESWKIK